MKMVHVLGCPIHPLTFREVLEKLEEFIHAGQSRQVVVVNAAKIIKMRTDPKLCEIVKTCDLIGVDGVPVIWAARLLGQCLPERINGTDLMDALIELAAEKNYRLYFFGAREHVLEEAIARVKQRYINVNIVGWRHGYFNIQEEAGIVEEINAAKPDILFVGMGTPKKEYWIRRHLARLKVPVIHGVGGSIDVLAGYTERAPVWMQRNGLEWLYRIFQEPRRMWKRYLITNSKFVMLVLQDAVRIKLQRILGRK